MSAARQKIRKDGSYPVEIKETVPRRRRKKEGADKKNVLSLQFGTGIKQQEIHVATRQLATLLGAGIPLVPALSGLVEQTTNKALQMKITQIKKP